MKVFPIANRVLVEPEQEELRYGSLYLPPTAADKPTFGIVRAVGPGMLLPDGTRTEMEVKVGDRIVYGKYSGVDFEIEGKKHLILRDLDIVCVVEKEG